MARRMCSRTRSRCAADERPHLRAPDRTDRPGRAPARRPDGEGLGLGQPLARDQQPGERDAGLPAVEHAAGHASRHRRRRSASSSTTLARLPPSSSPEGAWSRPAPPPIRPPMPSEPVKETKSTPGCPVSASPTTSPARHEVEHARRAARPWRRSRRTQAHSGASSDGLTTMVSRRRAPARPCRDLVQRVVPRRDRGDDAERLADVSELPISSP